MRIVFLPAADSDLVGIFSYINDKLQNPIAARNITTKILQRIKMLASFSEMGANLASIDRRFKGYRYLLVDSYLVIYRATDEEVSIVRILYARSDYIQLLQG